MFEVTQTVCRHSVLLSLVAIAADSTFILLLLTSIWKYNIYFYAQQFRNNIMIKKKMRLNTIYFD